MGPPQVPLYASATFKAGISSGCASASLSGALSHGTPDGVERNSKRARRRSSEPSPSGACSSARPSPGQVPGSSVSDRHAPDLAGKAPGQHLRVWALHVPWRPSALPRPGSPGQDHRGRPASWPVPSIYFRPRASQKGQQRSDPSSGRAPPGLPRPPPMVPQSFLPSFAERHTALARTDTLLRRPDLQRPPRRLSRPLPLRPPPGIRRHPCAKSLTSGLHNIKAGCSRAVPVHWCRSFLSSLRFSRICSRRPPFWPTAFICGLTACGLVGQPHLPPVDRISGVLLVV
ncbi:hypothetical protein NDU88_002328 [Pleurodeles waltl]|uniref:Uncharacterized protein n=1 Tax=Pleurodeles waltl TaxID=8319 RepID=A0AAV7VAV4_PLEWA|nr:hypothetical protein NDU88_002328 [Pleurodeles waltl]